VTPANVHLDSRDGAAHSQTRAIVNSTRAAEHVQVVVVGGGQAGLSVGYCLARRGLSFVILEANPRIGDSWRHRWDSLRLFTPAKYSGLIGLRFPAPAFSFPTKDEMANYLEDYAARFDLPVRTGTRVDRVSRCNGRYAVDTSAGHLDADHVVVAMATFQAPRIPEMARSVDPAILQLHSSEYKRPVQLRPGGVLLVGAGNSGAEIALDVARSHRTWLSGRHPGHLPFRIDGRVARMLVPFIFRVVFHRVLTVDSPLGRRARPYVVSRGGPLIRVKPPDLDRAGITRVPRLTGVRDGKPLLADERVLDVATIIWCTGFHAGLSWLDVPTPVDANGEPVHERGIVPGEPGLYFVGLHFLYAFSSTMIHGVARDAERIAKTIHDRVRAAERPAAAGI
jgi:putative flavoprotein involved in K+ transport